MEAGERMAYSPQEAAIMLGLCLNSIYKLLKLGRLRGVKVDRKILIPKIELDRLLSGNGNSIASSVLAESEKPN